VRVRREASWQISERSKEGISIAWEFSRKDLHCKKISEILLEDLRDALAKGRVMHTPELSAALTPKDSRRAKCGQIAGSPLSRRLVAPRLLNVAGHGDLPSRREKQSERRLLVGRIHCQWAITEKRWCEGYIDAGGGGAFIGPLLWSRAVTGRRVVGPSRRPAHVIAVCSHPPSPSRVHEGFSMSLTRARCCGSAAALILPARG
jgi:hypothetical protein